MTRYRFWHLPLGQDSLPLRPLGVSLAQPLQGLRRQPVLYGGRETSIHSVGTAKPNRTGLTSCSSGKPRQLLLWRKSLLWGEGETLPVACFLVGVQIGEPTQATGSPMTND
ncbi:hypothetical protein [Nostoc sp.]|uniref:hypothetical protein n=1 Tax=Nostoc sp. TaxID=1180 RepID=UPI002FF5FA41